MSEMAAEPRVRLFPNPDALARAAATEFVQRAAAASRAAGTFNVALAGGSTPRRLYALLAGQPYAAQIAWERAHFFWGDERAVPPGHPESNYGAAHAALLSRVPVPDANLHRIPAETGPEQAARAYESELRSHFRLAAGQLPRFDFVILGMGADGHTASLFPGSEALEETERLVAAPRVAKLGSYRITLTCPVFNNAAFILFLVTGDDKAQTLQAVLEGPGGRYPAQLIRPASGELLWYIDGAAGRQLRAGGTVRAF